MEMNGAFRFLVTAFLLALCYHWLGESDWSDMEEDHEDVVQDDFLTKFSQSLHHKSGDQVVKSEDGHFKPDFDKLHQITSKLEELRQSCLPRLVCELFAMEDKSKLTDSEMSLMTLISQTSLGTRSSSTSNYHFAAHMGQLLVGIDGNSCQYFYPACPLAGHEALALARRIKIR